MHGIRELERHRRFLVRNSRIIVHGIGELESSDRWLAPCKLMQSKSLVHDYVKNT